MGKVIIVAVVLFGACTTDTGAYTFALVGDLAEHRADIERAARAWEEMGFSLVDADDAPDITITVKIERLYTVGGVANQETDTVTFDPVLWNPDGGISERGKLGMIAHEIGHVLLDCGHLTGERDGIMRPGGGHVVTGDDWWLACQTIGRCR